MEPFDLEPFMEFIKSRALAPECNIPFFETC